MLLELISYLTAQAGSPRTRQRVFNGRDVYRYHPLACAPGTHSASLHDYLVNGQPGVAGGQREHC